MNENNINLQHSEPGFQDPATGLSKSNKKLILLYLSIIIVLTFISFFPSLKNSFTIWDDGAMITENNDIRSITTENIVKIFTKPYVTMYVPLTVLSFAAEYKFFGLNPLPYHIANLLLHLFNVILVFFFIYLLTKKINISVIAALFFGIHPMHVEAVAWVTARKDVLYSFFFFSALITYMYYLKAQTSKLKTQNYIFTLLLFIFSLLSKSAATCFPLVIILIDFYLKGFRFQLSDFKSQLNKIPFFIIAIIFGIIGIWAQGAGYEGPRDINHFSYFDRIFLGFYSASFYIIKFFLPTSLCAIHIYPHKSMGYLPIEYYIVPAFIIGIVITIILLKSSQLKKDIIFGTLFFLITMALVFLPLVGPSLTWERFTYVPYLGFVFAIVKICLAYIEKHKPITNIFIAAMVIVALLFSYQSYDRNKVWASTITLFTDVIEKYPEASLAYNNRGNGKLAYRDYKGAMQDFTKAIELNPHFALAFCARGIEKNFLKDTLGALKDFNKAIESDPKFAVAFFNRGNLKKDIGYKEGAIKDFNKAIELNPWYDVAFVNRGNAKSEIGDKLGALQDYNRAIQINPILVDALYNRGNFMNALGNKQAAIEDFNKSIKLNPRFAEAYVNRGVAKFALDDKEGAIMDYNKALQINPKLAQAYRDRSKVKYALGDKKGALEDYNKAIEINPKLAKGSKVYGKNEFPYEIVSNQNNKVTDEMIPQNAVAFYSSGVVKYNLGELKEALKDFNKAIENYPKYDEAYYNSGNTKYELGDKQGAIQDYTKAIEINPKFEGYFYNRGNTKKDIGDKQGAIQDFTKAIELNPLLVQAFVNRGGVKHEIKDNAGACADWKKAVELGFVNANAMLNRFCK
jgi:tetratricopeptide (TPR) repeat protein